MPVKPRILHAIKTLELGGAETNLRNLMQAFDPERFEHHIAYSFGGELEELFKKDPRITLFKYASGKHKIASFYTPWMMAGIAQYLVRNRIRVVHTHNFNGHFWAVYPAKLTGVKVVEHVHDFRYFDASELERRRGEASLNRHIGKFKGLSDRVVVLTEQNRRFLIDKNFYPENRVRMIPNGIPVPDKIVSSRKEVLAEWGLDEQAILILVASRLAPTKNIELILEIAPDVVREAPQAVFLVAGNGAELESYRQKVRQMGLEKSVKFVGFYEDVAKLLRAADIFLLPSYLELHSISILEAMSVGVPVVISKDVGCNSEVFEDGKTGFLRDPFSRSGWADAIVRLIHDPVLRADVGRRGRELCQQKFEIRRVAERFEELYRELAA